MPIVFVPPYYATRDYQLPLQGVAGFYYYDGYGNSYAVTTGLEHIAPTPPTTTIVASEPTSVPFVVNAATFGQGWATFTPSWISPGASLTEFTGLTWSVNVDSSLARATLVPAWIPAESVLAHGTIGATWSVAVDSTLAVPPPVVASPLLSNAVNPLKVEMHHGVHIEQSGWSLSSPHIPYNIEQDGDEPSRHSIHCDVVGEPTYDNPVVHEMMVQHGMYHADEPTPQVSFFEDDSGSVTYATPIDVAWFLSSELYPPTSCQDFEFIDPIRTIVAAVDSSTAVISYLDITLPFPPNPTAQTTNLTGTTETTIGAGNLT